MRPLQPQPGRFIAQVTGRQSPCRDHFELTLAIRDFPSATPGQFLQILCAPPNSQGSSCGSESDPSTATTRRPFSIAGMRQTGDTAQIKIVGRVIGKGTAWLDRCRVGDAIDLLGPLGRGFSIPDKKVDSLLVAGGVGVPPIHWLAGRLCDRNVPCTAIVGAMSGDLLPLEFTKEPANTGKTDILVDATSQTSVRALITTDDGSRGMKGRVTDGLLRSFEQHRDVRCLQVYACGPEAMLEAVAALCAERRVRCEVSLERMMACGIGACQSCVVDVNDPGSTSGRRYALCCKEGPVFDATHVRWSST